MSLILVHNLLASLDTSLVEPDIGTRYFKYDFNDSGNYTLVSGNYDSIDSTGSNTLTLNAGSSTQRPEQVDWPAKSGLKCAQFVSSSNELMYGATSIGSSGWTTLSYYLVLQSTGQSNNEYAMTMPFNNGGTNGLDIQEDGSQFKSGFRNGTPNPIKYTRSSTAQVIWIYHSGTAGQLYNDTGSGSTLQDSNSSSIFDYTGMSLGSFYNFSSFCWSGYIGEFVLIQNPGTQADAELYADYLASKWL